MSARVRQLAFMSGHHSTLFTHTIFWAFLPTPRFLSIIHGRFTRVIPLTTFRGTRDGPLAHSLTTLIRGLRLAPERARLEVSTHTQTSLLPCLPSHTARELLGRKLGISCLNPLSTQSTVNVCWVQLCSGRGREHATASARGLRRERPGPQRLPNEGRQQLE